jgi:hypothetical protein
LAFGPETRWPIDPAMKEKLDNLATAVLWDDEEVKEIVADRGLLAYLLDRKEFESLMFTEAMALLANIVSVGFATPGMVQEAERILTAAGMCQGEEA